MTPDGRRAWAFIALVGGCMVFTVFAGVGVYLVRTHLDYAFYLALAAHVQVLIGLTGIGALLIRRTIRVGKDGLDISDQDAAATGAALAADAAQGVAEELKP